MHVPGFRITIRRTMILVALVASSLAVGITADRLVRRRAEFQRRAAQHAQLEKDSQAAVNGLSREILNEVKAFKTPSPPAADPAIASMLDAFDALEREAMEVALQGQKKLMEKLTRLQEHEVGVYRASVVYHANLKRKYQRAAARPWQTVAPDSPDPVWTSMEAFMKMHEDLEPELDRIANTPPPEVSFDVDLAEVPEGKTATPGKGDNAKKDEATYRMTFKMRVKPGKSQSETPAP